MSEDNDKTAHSTRLVAAISNALQPKLLVPSLTSGLAIGILAISLSLSFSTLIYSHIPGGLALGVSLSLMGTAVVVGLISLITTRPGIVGITQSAPAAILALLVTNFAAQNSSVKPEALLITTVATIVLASLLTGVFLLLLGTFQLGDLVRFLPYPVVGGFLAGTGWLLVSGGIGIVSHLPLTWANLPQFFTPSLLVQWLPGLLFAILMLIVLNRYTHFLLTPALIAGAIAFFYLVLLVANIPVAQMSQQGWLMGPFPEGNLVQAVPFAQLLTVDWVVIMRQMGTMSTILLISVIALLLNATGLEIVYRHDLALNKELQVAGWANLGVALVGGLPGYQSISLSLLAHKVGGRSRLQGLIGAAIIAASANWGAFLLALIPRFVLGGILIYLGLDLLQTWVVAVWRKFPLLDYVIVQIILLTIAAVGFLQGIGIGLLLAIALFVINYSRVSIVKHQLFGSNYRSRVTRPSHQAQVLQQVGQRLYILQLQGFIFFGTANRLMLDIKQQLHTDEATESRFVLLDFQRVTGLDSTVMLTFQRLMQIGEANGVQFIFTGLSASLQNQLAQNGFMGANGRIHFFPDLDRGLEWGENQLLLTVGIDPTAESEDLMAHLLAFIPDAVLLRKIVAYFERLQVEAGYYLMRQNEPPQYLYFIESGQVTAQLEGADQAPIRLETMRGGSVVGEVGFYLNNRRTAAVITDEPTVLYRVSREKLAQIEQSDPVAAAAFHKLIVHLLSYRLTHLVDTVNALHQ